MVCGAICTWRKEYCTIVESMPIRLAQTPTRCGDAPTRRNIAWRRLAGDQIGGPEPCAQGRVAALHDRADGQSRLAAASATGQHARPRGDAERLAHDAAARAGESIAPPSPFQVGGAGGVIGKQLLKLGERPRELQIGAVENVHGSRSMLLSQTLHLVGVCDKRIGMVESLPAREIDGRGAPVVRRRWRSAQIEAIVTVRLF